MKRALIAAVAVMLVGLGWASGRAQTQATADFELSVAVTRSGQVTVECLRGCGLQFSRMTPNRSATQKKFTYGPCAPEAEWTTCPASLHGWIVP